MLKHERTMRGMNVSRYGLQIVI